MSPLAQVLLVGGGTLAMRGSMVTLLAGVAIPARIEQMLRLVAPAVLAAIVAQSLFLDDGGARALSSWHAGGLAAALVAWRTRNVGAALAVGMAVHWTLLAIS